MKQLFFLILIHLSIISQAQNTSVLNLQFGDDVEIPQQVSLSLTHFGDDRFSEERLPVSSRHIIIKKSLEEPVLADLSIRWKNDKITYRFLFPVDTGSFQIGANKKITVKFNRHKLLFDGFSTLLRREMNLIAQSQKAVQEIDFDNKPLDAVQKEIDSVRAYYNTEKDSVLYRHAIDSNKHSFLGVYSLLTYAERPNGHIRRKFQTDSLLALYQSFPDEMKNLPSMKIFHRMLLTEKSLRVGGMFPSLKLPDTLNRYQELPVSYGKYTLVDFWANWCVPCRQEHPSILKAFEKYKDRGFKVLSVSIDKVSDENLWLNAISNDGVGRWPHFIDADNQAREQLNIHVIPANFLLDATGKIIAKDLRGGELEAKLSELFK